MCCSGVQCIAVCFKVLQFQCVPVCCSVLLDVATTIPHEYQTFSVWSLRTLVVCCSVLQCVAVCCSKVQCGAVWCRVLQVFQGVAWLSVAMITKSIYQMHWSAASSVVQGVVVCCRVLQCVAGC